MQTKALAVVRTLANLHLRRSEDGQDLLEYGLLASLIAITAFFAVSSLGETIYNVFWETIGRGF
jgi:Flp pilus assembly pilin Flp